MCNLKFEICNRLPDSELLVEVEVSGRFDNPVRPRWSFVTACRRFIEVVDNSVPLTYVANDGRGMRR